MTHFEYLMVMVSIILGLGATQALRGLSKLVRSPKPFLPVALWALTLFYLHIQIWWGFWDMSGVPAWTQLSYYLLIFVPCALFAAAELLVPIGVAAERDWEEHFFSVRLWFFGTVITFQGTATLLSYILNDVPLTHPYRLVQTSLILITASGLFTRNRMAHVWISAIYLVVMLTGQIIFRLTPGLS